MEVWKCTTQLCCRRRVPLLLLSCKAILQSAFIWQIISTTAIPDFLKMSQEICSRGIFHFFLKQEEKKWMEVFVFHSSLHCAPSSKFCKGKFPSKTSKIAEKIWFYAGSWKVACYKRKIVALNKRIKALKKSQNVWNQITKTHLLQVKPS